MLRGSGPWIIRTELGDFQLVEPFFAFFPERVTREAKRAVLFTVQCAIERQDPEAIEGACFLLANRAGFPDYVNHHEPLNHFQVDNIINTLFSSIELEWIVIDAIRIAQIRSRPTQPTPGPQPSPKPKPETEQVGWFEVQVFDERGGPVPGLDLLFTSGQKEERRTTNAAGIARQAPALESFGSVRLASAAATWTQLKPRWMVWRGENPWIAPATAKTIVVNNAVPSISLEREKTRILVLEAPRTWISVVVVNDEGKAIVGCPVQLVLPNGEVVKLVLEESGIRVDNILEGNCRVILPAEKGQLWGPTKTGT